MVVDLPSALNDHSLAIMDAADQIVVLTALEITTIKNVRLFLEVADQLEYDRSKIRLVVNRSDSAQGIRIADVEASIRRPIDGTIVSDGRLAVLAVNRGVPFVVSHPDSPLSRDIIKLARTLAGERHRCQGQDQQARTLRTPIRGRTEHMSLLKRIERARPAAEGEGPNVPAVPAVTGSGSAAGSSRLRRAPGGGTPPRVGGPFLGALPARESFREAKFRVQNRLINELDPKLDLTNQVEVRRQIEELFGKIADEEGLALTRAERVRMLEQITDEILGLGPLEPLLRDETITEVMVNGPQQVYIEREGQAWSSPT